MAHEMREPGEGLTDTSEIGRFRLAAQRLAGPLATPVEVVRWLTAMQAQDHAGSLTSVALRTRDRRRVEVEAALDRGEIVKSWPMRGTLHLVAAEDLPWLLQVTAARVEVGMGPRRAQLELDTATLARARDIAVAALTDGRPLRRDELHGAWNDAGLVTTGQRGYHLIAHLAQTGVLCFGPHVEGEPAMVLVDQWIPEPRQLEREDALGELALRYFRSNGPATVKDFTRWTKLLAADVRVGVALARPDLASVVVDDVEYLMDPATPDLARSRGKPGGVLLLPGFDEFVLGYGDRAAVLDPDFATHIVPGGNGVFRPTVVHEGRIIGTWQVKGRGAKRAISAEPFTTFPADVTKAIEQAYPELP